VPCGGGAGPEKAVLIVRGRFQDLPRSVDYRPCTALLRLNGFRAYLIANLNLFRSPILVAPESPSPRFPAENPAPPSGVSLFGRDWGARSPAMCTDSPCMTLGRPRVRAGFAGCHVPVNRRQRAGESGGARRTAQKGTRHLRRVPVREETVRNISRFAAALCVVIHTRRGNSARRSFFDEGEHPNSPHLLEPCSSIVDRQMPPMLSFRCKRDKMQ
jgi:hypothetical protein